MLIFMSFIFNHKTEIRKSKKKELTHWECERAELTGQRGSETLRFAEGTQAFYPQTMSSFFQLSLSVNYYNPHFCSFHHHSLQDLWSRDIMKWQECGATGTSWLTCPGLHMSSFCCFLSSLLPITPTTEARIPRKTSDRPLNSYPSTSYHLSRENKWVLFWKAIWRVHRQF